MEGRFLNRAEAGRKLAEAVQRQGMRDPAIVLALPRGGVPVGFEVARALKAPLDLVLVRKIGMPFQPELALGAIVDGGDPHVFIDQRLKTAFDVPDSYVKEEFARQMVEIERRRRAYLGGRMPLPLAGRTAIVVDDGIATGATMRAALLSVHARNPSTVLLAVPVAPGDRLAALRPTVDGVICLSAPEDFASVGRYYRDFRQVDDAEVADLLRQAAQENAEQGTINQPAGSAHVP